MYKKINKTLKKYPNISDTFNYAYIGVPKGVGGLKEDYFGTYNEFLSKYPDFKTDKNTPVVLYMHGSSGLYTGDTYRKYIVQNNKAIFFAPNSFKIEKRPTYKSPVKEKVYIKVHKIRLAEIKYNLEKLKNLEFIDNNNIFLMGNSEGGLAAAIYKSKEFKGRIITAFSCESSYFYTNFKLGSQKDEPFLNIIGTHDQFFSKKTSLNKKYKVEGNGIDSLKKYTNAKIVILSKTKHDITTNIYVKDEITNFLNLWIKN
ncbi:MAG: hypothetical protein U9R39_01380 [Campylobacterota bacterium]|nr:hypothetical protein [Campylobacterota bacterium]